jgi:hypothetical protein
MVMGQIILNLILRAIEQHPEILTNLLQQLLSGLLSLLQRQPQVAADVMKKVLQIHYEKVVPELMQNTKAPATGNVAKSVGGVKGNG